MIDIDKLLTAEVVTPKSDPVPLIIGGELVEVIFYRAEGTAWAECTSRHPVRADVLIDMRYGYNFHGVCFEIAPKTGRLLDGDDEVELSPEKWGKILDAVSGNEVSAVANAIWALNEWDPAQLVKSLKKARTATSKKKPS